jgi:hypothetical protein
MLHWLHAARLSHLLSYVQLYDCTILVVFHPARPRDAIGQMIDAQNEAHAAEAADLAADLAANAEAPLVGGEVSPPAPLPEVRRAVAAEAAQRRFDSLWPRG